jgi:hypothetical protein
MYFMYFSPGYFAEDRAFTLSALGHELPERHEHHEHVEKSYVHVLSS